MICKTFASIKDESNSSKHTWKLLLFAKELIKSKYVLVCMYVEHPVRSKFICNDINATKQKNEIKKLMTLFLSRARWELTMVVGSISISLIIKLTGGGGGVYLLDELLNLL